MFIMGVRMYERKLNEWWREPGEKLQEATGYSGLKAGSDGKNVPSVTKKYSKASSDEDFGTEGANVMERKINKGRVTEAEEDLDDVDNYEDEDFDVEGDDTLGDMEGDEDFNPEADVPAEIEAPMPDITITIDGKAYTLVPSEVEADDEMIMDDEMNDDVSAEDIDVEDGMADEDFEEEDSFKEAIKASIKKKLAEKRVAALKNKKPVSKKNEKFTGKIYDDGNTDDFGHNLDTSYAKEGQAKTGKQYTASKSDSVYEARKAKIKAWLEKKRAAKKAIKEETADLDKEDTMAQNGVEDFANVAGTVGADPQLVERLAKIKARREARKREAAEGVEGVQIPDENLKKDLEASLNESFSFKELMNGKYGKK